MGGWNFIFIFYNYLGIPVPNPFYMWVLRDPNMGTMAVWVCV